MNSTNKNLLITAALPYSNGRPHVGHIAGCYLPADTYVRYQRLTGRAVRFVCGSDDYGVAIMLTGQKEGKTPREVSQFYNAKQKAAFDAVGISFDIWSGTSSCPYHTEESQNFFKAVYDKGYFEKVRSEQFYDEEKAVFLPDRFVKGTCGYCETSGQNGDQCENCGKALDVDTLKDPISVFSGKPATKRDTVHWYLDLSRFENEVREWLATTDLREHTRSYVSGLLSTGLVKRSMTRDIEWGIPVPLEDPEAKGKVLYVWFDAPIGYISNTKELCAKVDGDASKYLEWFASDDTEILHFIGEDNTIFHCVIWIAMLTAQGKFKLPKGVIVNQFLNIQFPGKEEEKISKSRGNAPWIEDLVAEGINPDSLRYYLTCIAPERARTAYNPADLVQRHNSELANVVGNFVNRILSFTAKHFDGKIPPRAAARIDDIDTAFEAKISSMPAEVGDLIERYQFKSGMEAIMEFARQCNKFVDDRAPWGTRKTDPERTGTTLAIAIHAIQTLGALMLPYLPTSGARILTMTGADPKTALWARGADRPQEGTPLGTIEILFTKIESTEPA